ncbi:hypothetical protein K2173_003784 [Erythroxylum novogranatense]|uniref:Uncharacterized protein n=1 Tax=Erythroxylum novogranatense TaxID=1862640 RepID=A0AAV8SJL5_9ROSI|nr:hypothetical protein K2173_003784 [Erythroxylum novogranatense]
MPLPWKKSRVPRISRIVADLQFRKHGNSLVLETGFPTSLVDLFVKNRDKLKRPFKSKKHKVQDQSLVEEEEIVVSDPVIVTNSRELDDVLEKNQTLRAGNLEEERNKYCGFKLVTHGHGNLVGSHVHKVVQDCVHGVREGENEKEIRKVRRVCVLTGLVMFMVVILGLSLKKLAVAITTSAFLFIFLEHVGDYVSCWSEGRPKAGLIQRMFCLYPPRTVVPISKKVKSCRHSEKQTIVQEEDYFSSHPCDMFDAPDGDFHCCGEEIQVLEGMVSQVEENRNMENNLDPLSRDKKLGYLQAMKKKRVLEVEGNGTAVLGSTKAKIKTKMRKLVRNGKKWRRNKVKEWDANNDGGGLWEEDKLEEADQIDGQQGLEDAGKSSGYPLAEGQEMEQERIEVGGEAEADMIVVVEKRMVIQRKDNNSTYPTFIIIILGGLVEGRMVAFSLTVAWWLVLKLVLRYRKCVN